MQRWLSGSRRYYYFFAAAIEGGIPPPGQFYYEFFYTAFQTQQVNVIIFKEWFKSLPSFQNDLIQNFYVGFSHDSHFIRFFYLIGEVTNSNQVTLFYQYLLAPNPKGGNLNFSGKKN